MNTVRKGSAVHVSLSSYLIVKQQSLVKQEPSDQSEKSDYPDNALAPGTETPGFFNREVFRPEETREKRSAPAAHGGVGGAA